MYTKVFVGNLSFKTKADELAAEFSAAGRVVSANIITRGPRSLGYGFVELESEEDARKAVNLLNKRSVDGREINVEIAKPRDEAKIAEKRAAPARRGGRRGGRGGAAGGSPTEGAGSPAGGNNNAGPAAGSPGSAPRSRGGPRRRYRGGAAGGNNNNNAATGGEGAQQGSSSSSSSSQGGAPRRRQRSAPRPRDPNRALSSTTLFVANLPFSLDDAGLSALFKDQKVAKAHVVKNRNGRSKGFGFVEFNTEADQKAALAASDKLTSENRNLIVKVALTPPEGLNNAAPAAPAAPASGTESKEAAKDTKTEGAKST
jgi:RNA recognition motif-containing protein